MSSILTGKSKYHTKYTRCLKDGYKENKSFEVRKMEGARIRVKYPDKIPIICERFSIDIPELNKKKYLCPTDLSLGNFLFVIRKRMRLPPEKAIYLLINDVMLPSTALLGNIYSDHKSSDGFLYIKYSGENTFG